MLFYFAARFSILLPDLYFAATFLLCRVFFILPQLFHFAVAFFCFAAAIFVLPWLFYFGVAFLFCRSNFCFAVAFCFAAAFSFCRVFLNLLWGVLFCLDFFILPWHFYFAVVVLFCRDFFILPWLLLINFLKCFHPGHSYSTPPSPPSPPLANRIFSFFFHPGHSEVWTQPSYKKHSKRNPCTVKVSRLIAFEHEKILSYHSEYTGKYPQ